MRWASNQSVLRWASNPPCNTSKHHQTRSVIASKKAHGRLDSPKRHTRKGERHAHTVLLLSTLQASTHARSFWLVLRAPRRAAIDPCLPLAHRPAVRVLRWRLVICFWPKHCSPRMARTWKGAWSILHYAEPPSSIGQAVHFYALVVSRLSQSPLPTG